MHRQSARVMHRRAALQPAPAPDPVAQPIITIPVPPHIISVPEAIVNFRGRPIRRAPVEVRISSANYTTIHALENIPVNSPARLLAVYAGYIPFHGVFDFL